MSPKRDYFELNALNNNTGGQASIVTIVPRGRSRLGQKGAFHSEKVKNKYKNTEEKRS